MKLEWLRATKHAVVGAVTCVNRSALVGEMNFMPAPGGHIEGLLIKTVDRFCNNRRKQGVITAFGQVGKECKSAVSTVLEPFVEKALFFGAFLTTNVEWFSGLGPATTGS